MIDESLPKVFISHGNVALCCFDTPIISDKATALPQCLVKSDKWYYPDYGYEKLNFFSACLKESPSCSKQNICVKISWGSNMNVYLIRCTYPAQHLYLPIIYLYIQNCTSVHETITNFVIECFPSLILSILTKLSIWRGFNLAELYIMFIEKNMYLLHNINFANSRKDSNRLEWMGKY